ncbi:hypothetical protein ACOSQ3_030174 [Xanthoceras sorbifolium]
MILYLPSPAAPLSSSCSSLSWPRPLEIGGMYFSSCLAKTSRCRQINVSASCLLRKDHALLRCRVIYLLCDQLHETLDDHGVSFHEQIGQQPWYRTRILVIKSVTTNSISGDDGEGRKWGEM